MSEENERIAALETNMSYVLGVLAKREDYQNNVLKSLTIIEMKLDQGMTYQKTCDAERAAHGVRLGSLENERELVKGYRRILRAEAGAIGSVTAFLVSLVTIYAMLKH